MPTLKSFRLPFFTIPTVVLISSKLHPFDFLFFRNLIGEALIFFKRQPNDRSAGIRPRTKDKPDRAGFQIKTTRAGR